LPAGRGPGESESDCVGRHMASEELRREFPDPKQRQAVAISKCQAAMSAHPVDDEEKKKKKKVELEHRPGHRKKDNKRQPYEHRFRIMQQPEFFGFQTVSTEVKNLTKQEIGNGITALKGEKSEIIGGFQFDRAIWTFDQVRQFLLDRGYEPNELEEAQFQETDEIEHVMFSHQMAHIEVKSSDTDDKGTTLMKASGFAMTVGEPRPGFRFTEQLLRASLQEWNEVPIAMFHKFTDPRDIVGFGTNQRFDTIDDRSGVIVDFTLFKKKAMDMITSGDVHAMSTNFMLTRNRRIGLVLKVDKVIELTLTHRPEDEDSVIIDHGTPQQVSFATGAVADDNTTSTNLNFASPTPPSLEANGGNSLTETQPSQTGSASPQEASVQLKLEVDTMQKNMVGIQEQLKKTEQALVVSHEAFQTEQKERIAMQQNVDSMAKSRNQENAAMMAKELVETHHKFVPSAQPTIESLYATFDAEQTKLFNDLASTLPEQVDFSDRGVPIAQAPVVANANISHLTPEQAEFQAENALLGHINGQWKAMGFDGPEAAKPYQQAHNEAFMAPFTDQPTPGMGPQMGTQNVPQRAVIAGQPQYQLVHGQQQPQIPQQAQFQQPQWAPPAQIQQPQIQQPQIQQQPAPQPQPAQFAQTQYVPPQTAQTPAPVPAAVQASQPNFLPQAAYNQPQESPPPAGPQAPLAAEEPQRPEGIREIRKQVGEQ